MKQQKDYRDSATRALFYLSEREKGNRRVFTCENAVLRTLKEDFPSSIQQILPVRDRNLCTPAREIAQWHFSLTCPHQSCLVQPVGKNAKRKNVNFFSLSAQTTRKRFLSASIQNNPRSGFQEPGCRGHALERTTLCHSHISWFPPGSWFTSPTCWVIIHYPAARFVSWIAVFNIGIVEVPNLRWLLRLPGTGLCSLAWQVFWKDFSSHPLSSWVKNFLSIWDDMYLGFYT